MLPSIRYYGNSSTEPANKHFVNINISFHKHFITMETISKQPTDNNSTMFSTW